MAKTIPKMNRSECGDGSKRVMFLDYLGTVSLEAEEGPRTNELLAVFFK